MSPQADFEVNFPVTAKFRPAEEKLTCTRRVDRCVQLLTCNLPKLLADLAFYVIQKHINRELARFQIVSSCSHIAQCHVDKQWADAKMRTV